MFAQRILNPLSKLATTPQLTHTTLAAKLELADDLDENDLYHAMGWLLARQPAIEKKLVQRHLSEGSAALYEVLSSYYEGKTYPLMRFGYSSDGKRRRPIVVYGVLTRTCRPTISNSSLSGQYQRFADRSRPGQPATTTI